MSVTKDAQRGASLRRPSLATLLPALAVGGVLLTALWLKGGALLASASRWQSAHEPANAASEQAGEQRDTASELPAEIRLASPEVAKSLGLECAPVAARAIDRTITCNGRASFNENHYAHLRSRVEGIVRRIDADLGAQVSAGEILAVIDSPLLGDVKSTYINALARRDQTEWDFERMKKLADQQAIPAKNLRESQTLFEQQQTTTANARQQLINLGFSAQQIKLLAETKDTTTDLPLAAPWPGVVVARHAVEGELVERNAPLFALADLRTMWVYLNLYESDLGQVHVGQSVTFTADGLAESRFAGTVEWISPEVDARTRTTQVRAQVQNTEGALRANMFGKGRIVVASSRDALAVPAAAVQKVGERCVVFVRESAQSFTVCPVTIGLHGEHAWEVLDGLRAGDEVVTTGSFLLKSELEKDKLGEAE